LAYQVATSSSSGIGLSSFLRTVLGTGGRFRFLQPLSLIRSIPKRLVIRDGFSRSIVIAIRGSDHGPHVLGELDRGLAVVELMADIGPFLRAGRPEVHVRILAELHARVLDQVVERDLALGGDGQAHVVVAQDGVDAIEQNSPKLRSRLSGVDQYGKLRYRHAEGIKCGCKNRSVFTHVIEDDFKRLITVLSIREDKLPLLVEMTIQAEHGGPSAIDDDFERQKQAAVAKLRRKIEAARDLFGDGDISREEYLKRKVECERDIVHWETRTTDVQKAAVELRMCMELINMIVSLWDESSDEDRQQLVRMIFEEIIYDLDQQRIVHFRLKTWAERFLDLRMALHLMENGNSGDPDGDDDGPGAGDGVPKEGGGCDDSGGFGGEVSGGPSGEKQNRPCLKYTSDLCPIEGLVSGDCNTLQRRSATACCSCTLGEKHHNSPLQITLRPNMTAITKFERCMLKAKRRWNWPSFSASLTSACRRFCTGVGSEGNGHDPRSVTIHPGTETKRAQKCA